MKLKETGQGRRAAGGRKDGANSKLPRLERTTVGKGAEKVGKETPPRGVSRRDREREGREMMNGEAQACVSK